MTTPFTQEQIQFLDRVLGQYTEEARETDDTFTPMDLDRLKDVLVYVQASAGLSSREKLLTGTFWDTDPEDPEPLPVSHVHAHIWAAEGTPEAEAEADGADPVEIDLEQADDYTAYVQWTGKLPDGKLLEVRLFRECTCGAGSIHNRNHTPTCVLSL
jgi:hypothetical protein